MKCADISFAALHRGAWCKARQTGVIVWPDRRLQFGATDMIWVKSLWGKMA